MKLLYLNIFLYLLFLEYPIGYRNIQNKYPRNQLFIALYLSMLINAKPRSELLLLIIIKDAEKRITTTIHLA